MTLIPLTPEERLEIAQIPGVGGLYFIGPHMPRITFYSQQVRALELAHAMDAVGGIGAGERIAIVGAGAAGTTMALALALLGKDVTLYDPATDVLALQSFSSRLLHPHIYEWPRLGSLEPKAGLPIMDWSADKGGDVVNRLRCEFNLVRPALTHFSFVHERTLEHIAPSGALWELRFAKPGGASETRLFHRVILSLGFGDERPTGTIAPEDYWRPGAIGTPASEPVAGAAYLVSGNGDGALTETLGLLIAGFEHVEFTRRFLGFFNDDTLRTIAQSVFGGVALLSDVEPALRAALLPVLESHGVIDRLRLLLRRDRAVTVNSSGPLFAAGKASQLNQCMVLAVLEAATLEGIAVRRSLGYVTDGAHSAAGDQVVGTSFGAEADNRVYKHAILRHGPDIASRYAPAAAYIGAYGAHVEALLAANATLAAPPELDMATFARFEDLRIERVADHASKLLQSEAAAASKRVIEVALDAAAHIVIERGFRPVADIADVCERLAEPVQIDLHVAPALLPEASAFVRLARCSRGMIALRAGSQVRSAWDVLVPGIPLAPEPGSPAPIRPCDRSTLTSAIDACLVRALDECILRAVADGAAPPIGTISPSILSAVSAIWSTWRSDLDADADLRFDFLRWLANVDQSLTSPWDGNASSVQRMANAIIMVGAIHAQEPMAPISIDRGNLSFASDAVALGTGCEAIKGEHLSVLSQPDDWGVDALILSAANEVIVQNPPGRISDGGTPSTVMTAARRVRPAIVQNDTKWRSLLKDSLDAWKAAISDEFSELRKRQDAELSGVTE